MMLKMNQKKTNQPKENPKHLTTPSQFVCRCCKPEQFKQLELHEQCSHTWAVRATSFSS